MATSRIMSSENCTFREMMYCNENLLDLEPYIMNMKNNGICTFNQRNDTSKRVSSPHIHSPFKTRQKPSKIPPLCKKAPEIMELDPSFDIEISDEVFYQIEEFLKREGAIQ